MILKKITIENFRCFKNYEVDLTPGITVFIGKNGAGKTSLLNAIRYGLSVFFSNDSTMGDDLLISGNPDLKVISTLATDFYRAQNADLPAVDLTIGNTISVLHQVLRYSFPSINKHIVHLWQNIIIATNFHCLFSILIHFHI